jgi:hypothetical protein
VRGSLLVSICVYAASAFNSGPRTTYDAPRTPETRMHNAIIPA